MSMIYFYVNFMFVFLSFSMAQLKAVFNHKVIIKDMLSNQSGFYHKFEANQCKKSFVFVF